MSEAGEAFQQHRAIVTALFRMKLGSKNWFLCVSENLVLARIRACKGYKVCRQAGNAERMTFIDIDYTLVTRKKSPLVYADPHLSLHMCRHLADGPAQGERNNLRAVANAKEGFWAIKAMSDNGGIGRVYLLFVLAPAR